MPVPVLVSRVALAAAAVVTAALSSACGPVLTRSAKPAALLNGAAS